MIMTVMTIMMGMVSMMIMMMMMAQYSDHPMDAGEGGVFGPTLQQCIITIITGAPLHLHERTTTQEALFPQEEGTRRRMRRRSTRRGGGRGRGGRSNRRDQVVRPKDYLGDPWLHLLQCYHCYRSPAIAAIAVVVEERANAQRGEVGGEGVGGQQQWEERVSTHC